MKNILTAIFLFCILFQSSFAQEISLNGTVWLESDLNGIYDGEDGINDLTLYLKDSDSDEIIDSAITMNYEYNFPSTDFNIIPPGNYYLEFAIEEYNIGGGLYGLFSCFGSNPANDFVDSDDNGADFLPTQTTVFGLDTGIATVTYIDFCFYSDCNEEPLWALETCDLISKLDIYCSISEMNNLCGLMPASDSPGSQPNPLCPDGGGPHNISWFAFIADEGDYSVTVTPTACIGSTTGIEGVQMGIYTDCTFTESIYCDPNCSTDPVSFSSDLLVPGQTYYFFIDGCSSSVCSYEISISGNPNPVTFEVDDLCIIKDGNIICEDSQFCEDTEVLFETNNQNGNIEYTWEIITLLDGPYEENPNPITEENNINLFFQNSGVYQVCITVVDNGCTTWQGNECRTITIENPTDEFFNDIYVCGDIISDFDVSVLNDQDPNGDGVFGWVNTDFEFMFGDNISTVTDSLNCTFEQQVSISQVENLEINLETSADSLCLGDTLNLMFDTSGDFDDFMWSVNDIVQTDPLEMLIPEVGEQVIVATITNICGSVSAEVIVQVSDIISAPSVLCDTSVVNTIALSWPEVDGVEGYSLSINGDVPFVVTDTSFVIENLLSGEIVDIEFNIIDPSKCVGPAIDFSCQAAIVSSISEYSVNDIKIIPNPTSDYINIDGSSVLPNASFQIFSIDSGLIMSGRLNDNRRIDVMDLPSGVYLITIDQNDNRKKSIGRFVKQ